MKALKRLNEAQRQLLIRLRSEIPIDISIDDVMELGANRLIEFDKPRGFKITKRGEKLLAHIEHDKR
jgi:hypothetical protein